MAAPQSDRFVRLSTELLEALIRSKLAGVQLRIILWVIRNTYGWNRELTPFTWYQISKELRINRGAAYRAGRALVAANVLRVDGCELAIQIDPAAWQKPFISSTDTTQQLSLPGMSVASRQLKALPASNA